MTIEPFEFEPAAAPPHFQARCQVCDKYLSTDREPLYRGSEPWTYRCGEHRRAVELLAPELERSCLAAWNEALEGEDNSFHALELATIAVEDYCAETHLPRAHIPCREVAIAALHLTPADVQSIEPWCPGHGDDQDCEIQGDYDNPCGGCRDAGFAQERGNLA